MKKDLISVADLTGEEIYSLIRDAIAMKTEGWGSRYQNKVLALLFEKPSLRTRVSFEVAMRQLGGESIYLSPAEVGLGERESVADVARVLTRYVNILAARTFAHETVTTLARYCTIPVVNALSDQEHPCQALADLMTVYEKKGKLKGVTVAYIGDGNNVANSLLLAATLTGMNFNIASPAGYHLQDKILKQAQGYAAKSGSKIFCTEKPTEAAKGADVLYTDVWTSMGQESETPMRRQALAGYQINKKLVSLAKPDAIIMHPLPAHHGEEVEVGLLDTPQSVVFDQAENRLHAQKALMARLLGGSKTKS